MNSALAVAGILAIMLGIVHSVLGEVLVFKKLRNRHFYSWNSEIKELPLTSIRILWASWHVVTVFGVCIGVILLLLDQQKTLEAPMEFIKIIIFVSIVIAGIIVLTGTRGRHPGWLVLFIISILIF